MAEAMSSDNTIKTDLSNYQPVLTTNNENKESTTLVWFDPNIGSREDTEQTKQQLRLINDYVIFHTDLQLCLTFIQFIDKEKIFLITSGSKVSQILLHVSSLDQVDSIFIYCMKINKYEHLLNEYPKIIGIDDNHNDLYKSIGQQIDLFNKQLPRRSNPTCRSDRFRSDPCRISSESDIFHKKPIGFDRVFVGFLSVGIRSGFRRNVTETQ
jgi:hypothetical protein